MLMALPDAVIGIRILHTDDLMFDVLVKLPAPHTFGAVSYHYAELDILVYQAHQAMLGMFTKKSKEKYRSYTV